MMSEEHSPIAVEQSQPAGRRDGGGPLLVLVIVCLLLGAALNWGWTHQQHHRRLRDMLNQVQTDQALLQARQSELAVLMADRDTRLIAMLAEAAVDSDAKVAVAWNDRRRRGVLFADRLPPASAGRRYHLWLAPQSDASPSTAIAFDASLGGTIIPFDGNAMSDPRRFWITLELPPSDNVPAGPVLYAGQF